MGSQVRSSLVGSTFLLPNPHTFLDCGAVHLPLNTRTRQQHEELLPLDAPAAEALPLKT
jgi:hypothetical protein